MKCLVVTVFLWSAAACQTWVTEPIAQEIPSKFTEQMTQELAPDFSKVATLTTVPFTERAIQLAQDEFLEHVARLVSNARISEGMLKAVPLVLCDLEQVFNATWPGSRVIVFGSLVYGLALSNSDIDCALQPPYRADMTSALNFASKALSQHPQLFVDLGPITMARVPVVTFKHAPTQFKVDLTIDSYDGVQLTNMFSYLFNLNERIYKLAFVVKRWAIARQLTTGPKTVISKYGVTLMVIFYLQQRNLMPSIAALQVNADPFFDNEWNMGYREIEYDMQKYVPLDVLIGDFFKYYAVFDYDKYIVCPYAGYPVDKRAFADINKVPNEFGLYVHNVRANVSKPLSLENTFVLQHLLFHNLNVANSVDVRPNSTFITQLQTAAREFRENNIEFIDELLLNQ